MSGQLVRVTPTDLHASAAKVDLQAESVMAVHTAADGRVEAAQPGVPAGAAAALTSALTRWRTQTAEIVGRLDGHSAALRGSGADYVRTEEANTDAIARVGNDGALRG